MPKNGTSWLTLLHDSVTCKTEGIVHFYVTAQQTCDDATKQESVGRQRPGKQRLRGSGDIMQQ
jgi:hypothetical protein